MTVFRWRVRLSQRGYCSGWAASTSPETGGSAPSGVALFSARRASVQGDCARRKPGGAVSRADSGQWHSLLRASDRRSRSGSWRPGAGRQDC